MARKQFILHARMPKMPKKRSRIVVIMTGILSLVGVILLQAVIEFTVTMVIAPPTFEPFPTLNMNFIAPESQYANMMGTQMAIGFDLPTPDIFASAMAIRNTSFPMWIQTAAAEVTAEVTETPTPNL